VERLQREKKHDRGQFIARVSSTDPEARVMRNGEGRTVPVPGFPARNRIVINSFDPDKE